MFGARGRGSLTILDARHLADEEIRRLVASRGLDALAELRPSGRPVCPNQMFHRVTGTTLFRVFGAGDPGNSPVDGAIWCPVWLAATPHLPVHGVTEFESTYDMDNGYPPDIVVGGGSAYAWNAMHVASEEAETHRIYSEGYTSGVIGLRAVHRTVRFLWTKAQAVSSEIRSVYFGMSPNGNGWSTCWDGYGNGVVLPFARIRLLDSGGQPMTMTKTADEVAVLEYTMSLISL